MRQYLIQYDTYDELFERHVIKVIGNSEAEVKEWLIKKLEMSDAELTSIKVVETVLPHGTVLVNDKIGIWSESNL